MKLGYIGLGKMGRNHVLRLHEKGHEVIAWNRSKDDYAKIEEAGVQTVREMSELVGALEGPRVVWLMVTHSAVDAVLETLAPLLSEGDIVIDGGNSFYKETVRRGKTLAEKGIHFVDAGVSGGPDGSRNGSCIMYGGDGDVTQKIEQIFVDSAAPNAYKHMGPTGAGHFTKMVHNGIEYGMMQALAEGFAILKESEFSISVTDAADIYNNRSVIESRLVEWAHDGFIKYGEDLDDVKGSVSHTGEGKWTVEAGHELNLPVPVIESAFQFRVDSENNPSYTGQIVSMLRNMFGGHSVKK